MKMHHAPEGLLPIARDDHALAVAAPANDLGAGTQIGETGGGASFCVHDPRFGMSLVAAGEGDLRAIGGEPRKGDCAGVGRESASRSARQGHGPEVVFGHKNNGVPGNGRVTIVAKISGHENRVRMIAGGKLVVRQL